MQLSTFYVYSFANSYREHIQIPILVVYVWNVYFVRNCETFDFFRLKINDVPKILCFRQKTLIFVHKDSTIF